VTCDLLVIGGGIAGASAAARAAEAGANVVVVEKDDRLGGSGALSAGILWTAPDRETLRRVCPRGDLELGGVLVDEYDAAVERVREAGVDVSERWYGQMGFGVAHRVDIGGWLEATRERLEQAGRIAFGHAADELIVEDGEVRGARVSGAAGDEEIRAGAVLLATGGFQGDPSLVRRLIGEGAERMLLRANPHSVGDGFRIGQAAGAAPSGALDSFYGHMLPSPLERLEPEDYLPLTQYHSHACVVVNRFGRRFADESRGDEVTNQALLRQAGSRGVLLCDERVRVEHAVGPPYPHGQVVDRFAAARASGARVATADSLDELVELVAGWGVTAVRLRQTLADVEAAADGSPPPPDDVAIAGWPPPLTEDPFHAVEVQPAITFTFGGLRGDTDGRALDRNGEPVRGLFVAGADLGGLQEIGYVGGLVLGLVYGPRAADAALGTHERRTEGLARG
jgi:succinate dehydrogenase/fumarate reductase flavoprotein subunit